MPKKLLLKQVGKSLSEKARGQIREKMKAEKAKPKLSAKEKDAKFAEFQEKIKKAFPPKPVKPTGAPAGKKIKMMEKAGAKVLKNEVKKYKAGGKIRGVGCAMRGYGKAMKG